jgi:hypothetical protein
MIRIARQWSGNLLAVVIRGSSANIYSVAKFGRQQTIFHYSTTDSSNPSQTAPGPTSENDSELAGISTHSHLETSGKDIHSEKSGENSTNNDFNDTFMSNEDFDLLNDFIFKEYQSIPQTDNNVAELLRDSHNSTENTPDPHHKPLESISNMAANNIKQDLTDIDIDKSDETVFDMDFLKNKDADATSKVHEQEKLMFQNIFNTYVTSSPTTERRNDGFSRMKQALNSAGSLVVRNASNELANVSQSFRNEMFAKTKDAMAPTINYLDSMNNVDEAVDYFEVITKQWLATVSDKLKVSKIFLSGLLKNTTKLSKKHETVLEEIRQSSTNTPNLPILNVFTFPIIFNKLLETVAYKLQDGQLAITLFNLLKKDLNLYSSACNQDTYNEILKLQWIYYGKNSLYNVEMIYLEMINNGFGGDLRTFHILKQIIVDYHQLKMAKSQINYKSGLPIWSREDDKRVQTLEWKLTQLHKTLTSSFSRLLM